MVKSVVTNESAVKPLYSGNGTLILEPTYKHILLVNPSDWDGGVVVEEGRPDEIMVKPKEERTRQFLSRIISLDPMFYI